MSETPALSQELIARTATLAGVQPLAITETGGGCRELTTTLPNGNILSITNDDADLPGYFTDDPDLFAWIHTPDSTDPLDEVYTTNPDDVITFITQHAHAPETA